LRVGLGRKIGDVTFHLSAASDRASAWLSLYVI
jgi:hypothetical protein